MIKRVWQSPHAPGRACVRAREKATAYRRMTDNRFSRDSILPLADICPSLPGLSITLTVANIPDPVAQAKKGLKKAAAPF
ncbi:MAG: hypothetical protein WBZ29_14080 [Methanocella sp.]